MRNEIFPKSMKRKSSVHKFAQASDEMKVWSSALAAEAADWPKVETRSFFGFTALYRGDRIFAALPRTRAMWTPNSIGFKIESPSTRIARRLQADHRVASTRMQKAKWFLFEISEDPDLHDALDWLAEAYEGAGKKARKEAPRPKHR